MAHAERVTELVADDQERRGLVDPRLRAAAQSRPAAAWQRREDIDKLLVAGDVVASLLRERVRFGRYLAVLAGRGPC